MSCSRVRLLAFLSLMMLLGIGMGYQVSAAEDGSSLNYWYVGNSFDLDSSDDWVPFFSLVDVPYSLPLRGFNSDSRNYFLDFGAVEWLTDWVEYVYGWPVPDHDKKMDLTNLTGQLEYLFEMITGRLEKPHSYVDEARNYTATDYVKHFDAPYEVFIPIVVMYNFNESYDEADTRTWVIDSQLVEDTFNEAFPLVTWDAELFWYNFDNASVFADLVDDKTLDVRLMIDDNFLERADAILHSIIFTDPRYETADMVLPSLVMLQDLTLWSVYYNMAVGGLGRIHSAYPEVGSWNLNGRNVFSYFYGGDPGLPRIAITPTVIHELGHCAGQTDIHSEFGWLAASSCMSAMAAYQQPAGFDGFDKDLINNAQGLQLMERYLDEIEYFRGLSLEVSQEAALDTLENGLSSAPDMLIDYQFDQLRTLLSNADAELDELSTEIGIPRKVTDWSNFSTPLDVHIDWIVGPGIPNAEDIVETIESQIQTTREIVPFVGTTLPTPRYNVTIEVHSTSEWFDDAVLRFWGRNLVQARTSSFSAEQVPDDAFDTMPRNRVFQNQSGYAIDGFTVESWLTRNPYTPEKDGTLHYRLYVMNLENLSVIPPSYELYLVSLAIVGGGIILAAVVLFTRARSKADSV